MMITDGGLTRPEKRDFFSNLTSYLSRTWKSFSVRSPNASTAKFEGTGLEPKDMFNGTITDFVYFAGSLMQVWKAVREGRHDVVTDVGWDLAQALQDQGKFQDSLEVWNAVLSSRKSSCSATIT